MKIVKIRPDNEGRQTLLWFLGSLFHALKYKDLDEWWRIVGAKNGTQQIWDELKRRNPEYDYTEVDGEFGFAVVDEALQKYRNSLNEWSIVRKRELGIEL